MTWLDKITRRLGTLLLPRRPWCTMKFEHHGTDYGGWNIVAEGLGPNSIVYSLGVGEDISFDLSVIARYGVQVFAFDPTPRSIDWVRAQSTPPQFHMLPYGAADYNGKTSFFAPEIDAHVSHTMLSNMSRSDRKIEVDVRRIGELMKMCGHSQIEMLKMDIEGAEYAVINDLISSNILPRQIVVEFHHRMLPRGSLRTWHAVRRLRAAGYDLFAITPTGDEYSFWRRTS